MRARLLVPEVFMVPYEDRRASIVKAHRLAPPKGGTTAGAWLFRRTGEGPGGVHADRAEAAAFWFGSMTPLQTGRGQSLDGRHGPSDGKAKPAPLWF